MLKSFHSKQTKDSLTPLLKLLSWYFPLWARLQGLPLVCYHLKDEQEIEVKVSKTVKFIVGFVPMHKKIFLHTQWKWTFLLLLQMLQKMLIAEILENRNGKKSKSSERTCSLIIWRICHWRNLIPELYLACFSLSQNNLVSFYWVWPKNKFVWIKC